MTAADEYYERLLVEQATPVPAHVLASAMERLASHSAPDPGYAPPSVLVADAIASGPEGDVPVRVYLPARAPEGPRPLLLWCHGGGWVEGDLDMPEADATAREVCARSGSAVVSVDYRLATAGIHYPLPLHDVLTAWHWALKQAARWGASPARAVLGGASAGGNLAAGAALALRDAGGPQPASLLLVYPALHRLLPDLTEEQRAAIGVTEAVEEYLRMRLRLMLENYLGADAADAPPYVAPADADLTGLPPTLVITCEYDMLRVSGEQFVQALEAAGTPCRLLEAKGVGHAHINTPWLAAAQASYGDMATWVANS